MHACVRACCHDKFTQPLDKFNSTAPLYFHIEPSSILQSLRGTRSNQGKKAETPGAVLQSRASFRSVPCSASDRQTCNHPDSLILQGVAVNRSGGGGGSPIHIERQGVVFLGEINTSHLINRASHVCMMIEIRRGEERQVAQRGWAKFTAWSPRRNYLTSLLIKSAYTAAHYNGRLIYSWISSSVQFSGIYARVYVHSDSPPHSLVLLRAHRHYGLLDSGSMRTDSRIRIALVFAMH